MLYKLTALLAVLLLPALARAAIQTRTVPILYGKDSGGNLLVGECTLAWDDAVKVQRPGVLVFPEWWGLTDYAKARAQQLAQLGYVAMAVDVYGNGQTTEDPKQAAEWATVYKSDRKLFRARCTQALDTFRKLREVDPNNVGAIGYCFGGTAVLELARSGANLKAVVSFHGDLATPTPADAVNIRAKVLVCHGAVDPFVPQKVVADFQTEMENAKVDYVLAEYAHAVHSFTNPAAGRDPAKGMAYNAAADARSWVAMKDFLEEAFK